jgi:membrane protease YdiL (CAAX protease family)
METTQKPLVKRGWQRAVIYIVGVALIVIFIQLFSGFFIGQLGVDTNNPENSVLSFTLVYSFLAALVFAFTLFMRRLVDRESFESLGFTWKGYSNEAGLGFFTAFAILGIGSLILVAIGYLSFITITFDATPFLMEIVVMIIVAFVEELLFRGYLLHNLMLSLNKWIALVISALLFSAFHSANPDVSVFAIVNIFIAGLLLGINYIFTKNLWFGICFHFAWNYLQGPVFGYEVSGLKLSSLFQQSLIGPELWTGGPFGFEGSLLCSLLLAISLAMFAFAFTKRYQESQGFDGNNNS